MNKRNPVIKRKWMWIIAIKISLSLENKENLQQSETRPELDTVPASEPQNIEKISASDPQIQLDWSKVSDEAPKSKMPWDKKKASQSDEDHRAFLEKEKQSNIEKGVSNIPVYLEEELLFHLDKSFDLCRDASIFEDLNGRPFSADGILMYYPTTAVRDRGDGMIYLMYATDTGYRMYLHLSDYNGYMTPTGFTIIIGEEVLAYENFKKLTVGDTIDKVAKIDPVAGLIKKETMEVWDLNPAGAQGLAKAGYPVTTVHYLRDGILKIEYDMQEDQTLYITNMVYNENYELVNPKGRTVNYWIETVDLPATTQKYVGTLAPRPELKPTVLEEPVEPEVVLPRWLAQIEQEKETDPSKAVDEIPVYREEELLFHTDGLFYLGQRNRLGKKYTAKKNGTDLILERYPTTAIREKKNGTKYLMYDTDTGYRLYLFLDKKNDYATPVYAPIVIGEEVLSYEDFQGLKRGDTIADVIEIDPVAGLVYKEATEVLKLDGHGFRKFGETHPITSVHYLQEGILEISYTQYMKASTVEPRIENMNLYDHDHMIVSHRAVDCQIEEIDLPKS